MRTPPRSLSLSTALALAVVVPVLAALALSAALGWLENTSAALVLVLLVVGAASLGHRAAGLLAAAVSAASFDFFLTAPYNQFRINDPADIETAVLLLLVGVAFTEMALWGRRQKGRASQQEGYLDGILQTMQSLAAAPTSITGSVADGVSDTNTDIVIDQIRLRLIELLVLDQAEFLTTDIAGRPTLGPDGVLRQAGRVIDVDRVGLPTTSEIALPVHSGRTTVGWFRLVASTRVARPTVQQRQVAAALADLAAQTLVTSRGSAA